MKVSQVLTPLFFEGNDSEANDTRLKGVFSAGIPIPLSKTLDDRETSLQGEQDREDRENFLRFMRKMLQWEPEKRSCARELAEDEWILKHTT
jgi:serine/threonine-protein kinase SRPK3